MYSSLQWFRDHGFSQGDFSDTIVIEAIREASLFIENFTGMWYESRTKTLRLDGNGFPLLHLQIPILEITGISIVSQVAGSSTDYISETIAKYIVIYNRRNPDDRGNPKLHNHNANWTKGRQNIHLTGRFGYTDANPSYEEEDGVSQGEVTEATITGDGLDDLSSSGTHTGAADLDIVVEIDASDTPDTYKISTDGGTTWNETGIVLTTDPVLVADGAYFTFLADTGHTLGDKWSFKAKAVDWLFPWDIQKVTRLLVAQILNFPLEDIDAQFELDQMSKVKSERTDKHSVTYRSIPLGPTGLTGNSVIDQILIKYKALRPKYGGWI